jgi:hypothetical protein
VPGCSGRGRSRQFRQRFRRQNDIEMLQGLGTIIAGQTRDSPSKDAVQTWAGAVALIGCERVAGDASAKKRAPVRRQRQPAALGVCPPEDPAAHRFPHHSVGSCGRRLRRAVCGRREGTRRPRLPRPTRLRHTFCSALCDRSRRRFRCAVVTALSGAGSFVTIAPPPKPCGQVNEINIRRTTAS